MVKKDRSVNVNKTYLMQMLPLFYQTHLKSQLSLTEYLLLKILLNVLQVIKNVSLEKLATALPLPIVFVSRRKKLQRFLSIKSFNIQRIWFPIIHTWLETYFTTDQVIYLVIDRTSWGCINLLMISVVWDKRAFPVYFELLPKLGKYKVLNKQRTVNIDNPCCITDPPTHGSLFISDDLLNSNFSEQQVAFTKVLPIFTKYKTVVLGDREFCSVRLANWLREKGLYFCLRLKKNEFVQVETEIWYHLNDLGLSPGVSFFLQGVKVTKIKGFLGFNLACKWKRKYLGWKPEEGWFILTNLPSLDVAIIA